MQTNHILQTNPTQQTIRAFITITSYRLHAELPHHAGCMQTNPIKSCFQTNPILKAAWKTSRHAGCLHTNLILHAASGTFLFIEFTGISSQGKHFSTNADYMRQNGTVRQIQTISGKTVLYAKCRLYEAKRYCTPNEWSPSREIYVRLTTHYRLHE